MTAEDELNDATEGLAIQDNVEPEIPAAGNDNNVQKENELREELEQLQKTGINKSAVLEMKYGELASVLAAFMVPYDGDIVMEFQDMRCRLKELFKREWIRGAALVAEDDEDAAKNREDVVAVLVEGRTERVGRKMKKRFEEFRKQLQEDVPNATSEAREERNGS